MKHTLKSSSENLELLYLTSGSTETTPAKKKTISKFEQQVNQTNKTEFIAKTPETFNLKAKFDPFKQTH